MKLTLQSLLLAICFMISTAITGQDVGEHLYKCITVQASPGNIEVLQDRLQADLKKLKETGEEPGYMFRHHQGDQWDLFVMIPIGSYDKYFKSKAAEIFERKYGSPYYDLVALQEEGFVKGPGLDLFRDIWQNNTYFHSEMFISLGGKHKELYKEREMENDFGMAKGGIYNMIFTRENGFKWDIFTLGGYRDFAHYAETRMYDGDSDAAAKKAGFNSAGEIGGYLRSLILLHHDTLGGKIDY